MFDICRLDTALDLEYDITSGFTGSYFEEEIKGLADASGADEKKIRRIHMIGELTYVGNKNCITHVTITILIRKGQCSMFGANGSATIDNGLLQLRALDWNVDGQHNIIFCQTHNTKLLITARVL